ncbi:hypothetical protein SBV1_1940025 [Verrucomicrobia bacterium]|nr:hypothetical protein SBV1_1940025 [Verrucomicrobiota bacterium]
MRLGQNRREPRGPTLHLNASVLASHLADLAFHPVFLPVRPRLRSVHLICSKFFLYLESESNRLCIIYGQEPAASSPSAARHFQQN